MGCLILHCSKATSHPSTWYDRNNDYGYILTDALVPPLPAVPLAADNPTIQLEKVKPDYYFREDLGPWTLKA